MAGLHRVRAPGSPVCRRRPPLVADGFHRIDRHSFDTTCLALCAIRFGEVMKTKEVLQAWARILNGRAPSLSIEITKECPLRCPGCYAFDAAHLGGTTQLRDLSDFKGDELVNRVLALVDEHKPLHA